MTEFLRITGFLRMKKGRDSYVECETIFGGEEYVEY